MEPEAEQVSGKEALVLGGSWRMSLALNERWSGPLISSFLPWVGQACRGPSNLVKMRPCGNPGCAPGTLGCGLSGLHEYGALGSSDHEVPGGLGAFEPLCGPLIPLWQFSCWVCRVHS